MSKRVIAILAMVFVMGSLTLVMKAQAPKQPPPSTREVWNEKGIPVATSVIVRGDMLQSVEVTGDISALNKVTLSAKIPGRVVEVRAREGDTVGAGETIIVLDQEDARSTLQQAQAGLQSALARLSQAKTSSKVTNIQTNAAIEQAKANLRAAEARLAIVKQPVRSQEQVVAENNVASAKANLDNAEANYKRHKQLLNEGAISQATFDVVKSQYLVAKSQYDSAKQQLSLVKEGGRDEDIRAAQAQVEVAREALRTARANASQTLLAKEDIKSAQAGVEQARANVALALQQLENTYVKSSISGRLASRLVEPGQVVNPGQILGEIVGMKSLFFKGDVSEKEIVNVKRGQTVNVRVDAVSGRLFSGVVDDIYPAGSTANRNFPVRIRITDGGDTIRPGMFARGEVITGTANNVLLVPKEAVEDRQGTKIVFTTTDKKKVKRHDVKVVAESAEYAQIAVPTDLAAGDIVITAGRQNLQDGSKIEVRKDVK